MKQFFVVLKKEFFELFKTKKIFIMLLVLVVFGLMSPVLAKYTPELLKMAMKSSKDSIKIDLSTMPKPTIIDSYVQFFKNIGQIGFLTILIICMVSIVEEKNKGTVVLVLTKGVSRVKFILAKYIAYTISFTVAYSISVVGFFTYTYILFNKALVKNGLESLFLYWLFGILLISVILFFSTVGKSVSVVAVLSIVFFFGVSMLPGIPYVGKYTPGEITAGTSELLAKSKEIQDLYIPIIVTVVSILVAFLAATYSFKKQEL